MTNIDVVTGAFSYSGRFIAAQLLERGRGVRTLTNHPRPDHSLASRIPTYPLDFSDSAALVTALTGTDTLYNTYWVRAPHRGLTHGVAVENTKRLIDAAGQAGVRRIVQTSIANPTASTTSYYRGKAALEDVVRSSGLSYAIVRPTLLFGEGDVLINNIAWLLRHIPVFGIPGNGRYRLQPMHVKDHAGLLVEVGSELADVVVDSAGPEIFTFDELVHLLRRAMNLRTVVIHVPPVLAMAGAAVAGRIVGDMLLTRDELDDLIHDILLSHEPPRGTTRLTEWLPSHRDEVGLHYASEMVRHYLGPRPTG
ncbi:MAG: NAD-dependent epimerase/dehydratase family protein [Chloroflexi bacterium]|nr:MAG: NAD-dependent epimerase/dehydratase family protein [Chloroflexota bacterium]